MSLPPLFNAQTRQFFRDFANSVTDYGTTVGVRFVVRNGSGEPVHDRDGEMTYAAAVDYPALVIYEQKVIAGPQGEQRVSRGEATFSWPPPVVTTDDRLVIDGGEVAILGVSRDDSTDPMAPTKAYI